MHALFFTAYDRPQYLHDTLRSWEKVRGIQDWHVQMRIEPSHRQGDIYDLFHVFAETMMLRSYEIVVNPEVYGVLHHPYVGFRDLFLKHDFVVRTEDDLIVSDDVLEYFTWAEEHYRQASGVATVHGFSRGRGQHDEVITNPEFNPWVWGTWKPVWDTVLEHTWDHAYTTYNVSPGFQSGWDWNINTRIFPKYGYRGAYPVTSRVDNIGYYGVHGTPDIIEKAPAFQEVYGTLNYREFAPEKVDTH